MRLRLGDVLVQFGALSEQQRDQVLRAQADSGRPFGALAEELFGLSPRTVERAWASQYTQLTGLVDLHAERRDAEVLPLVERRQAWQFQVLPLRFEGSELVLATTEDALARAMRFVGWAVGGETSFVVASPDEFADHLASAYPLPGGASALQTVRHLSA